MSALVSCLVGCGPSPGDDGGGGSNGDAVDGAPDGAAPVDAARADAASRIDAGPVLDAAPPVNCGVLPVVYRDFQSTHPDFEAQDEARMGSDRGIVTTALGADKKPVYAHAGATRTVTGPGSFGQWYNTDAVGDVNREVQDSLRLLEDAARPGVFVFDDPTFFPLNGRGFETGTSADNFWFTTEIHATFRYVGGERFTFQGDDDLFVFVNGRRAIDLGGVHTPEEGVIDFDARAAELGITPGVVYALDIFHAERHRVQSSFYIETTIECFLPPVD